MGSVLAAPLRLPAQPSLDAASWLAPVRVAARRCWPAARSVAPHLTLACAALVLIAPALTSGSVHWQEDTKFFYYPILATLANALKQGTLPLWEPGVFGGYRLFADGRCTTWSGRTASASALPSQTRKSASTEMRLRCRVPTWCRWR